MPLQGKFNYVATSKTGKKIPSFFLYAVLDKNNLRKAEFSYWIDLSAEGVSAVVEMCGCFRNRKYYDRSYLREDIEAATGKTAEPFPDLNIWEIIPSAWETDGDKQIHRWDISQLDPPWDDEFEGSTAGSSSAGGSGGIGSWHPYGRVAYAVNATGTVEWGGRDAVYALNSGGTQCGWTTADGVSARFSGGAQRKWGYKRGIAAQSGSGEKIGSVGDFKPISYGINTAAGYGSCWAYLQHPSFGYWYWWPNRGPSPYSWETHGPPRGAIAFGIDSGCAITQHRGSGGLSSLRAGSRPGFSPAGPGSKKAGSPEMSGYKDCGGYVPAEWGDLPPLLFRFNPGHDGRNNNFRPGGRTPEEYDDPPSKEPAVELPEQPTVRVFIGSSEWEPMEIYSCAAGEFFAMHPLDVEDFKIVDPERPALNTHPIHKLMERSDQWMPNYGLNWGQEQRVYQDSSSYSDVIPGQAKTYFQPRSPGIGESICAHHLIVISSRHQIAILKLGAMPCFGVYIHNNPDFVTQRTIVINIFDGQASASQYPVPLAEQLWEFYFNDGDSPDSSNNRNKVNDFRYPEHIQKLLRYHWWYHRGHYEAVYIRVDRLASDDEPGNEMIETTDQTRSSNQNKGATKPNVSYFGTSDFVHAAPTGWYTSNGAIKQLQGMPFQRVEMSSSSFGDTPYYDTPDGSLNRDYIGYALTSTSRLDLEKLWVCVGVGEKDWEKTFGSIVPTKLCFTHEQTYESAPWLYLALNWTSLGAVQLKFIESNIKLGETLPKTEDGYIDFEEFDRKWEPYFTYEVTYDPNNLENIQDLKRRFGEWLTIDYLKNWQDYGTKPPTTMEAMAITGENDDSYFESDPIYNTLFWMPKKNATLCYSTLNFPSLNPQTAILLGVAGISTSEEIQALIPRFYGGLDEEERHQLSREDRERIFRDDKDFYRELGL